MCHPSLKKRSRVMSSILPKELQGWIKERLFDSIPMSIAVIDRDFNLVAANRAFENLFGKWAGKKCHSVYKSRQSHCPRCDGAATFEDGEPRVGEEAGYNKDGAPTRYIKYTVPITDENGEVPFLVEMSTDITERDRLRREVDLLFDQVPCKITVLDPNLRIVRTNHRLSEKFGDVSGRFCYEVFKGRQEECASCPARRSFQDGDIHTEHSIVKTRRGEEAHLHVTTAPITAVDGKTELVMEMAVDITENLRLEEQLKIANSFLETLIATSLDGIIAVDERNHVTLFNASAHRIFEINPGHRVLAQELYRMLPAGFIDQVKAGLAHVYQPETEITTLNGEPVPARLIGVQLWSGKKYLGMAFSVHDLCQIKKLEKANLEAERLAAVGQTVAGLAHGIKNLVAGLEGGMYMLNTGLKRSDGDRIVQGWEILDRNIGRIGKFVKAFLSFSRGREISVEPANPAEIARDVVQLYAPNAEQLGIELTARIEGPVERLPLDAEGIHECLTNLVGNAIDACQMNEGSENGGRVVVRTRMESDRLIYEVEDDGLGMDYDVKQKVFTTFFTSKGLGGTGLGLLTTRKIIQEHGGRIEVDSEQGKGSVFRVILPKERLLELNGNTLKASVN